MSEATVNGTPKLVLVRPDPNNPDNILASYTPVTSLVNEMAVSGDLLYATSQQGLTIYNIGSFDEIPLTVSVEVPNGVSIVSRFLQHAANADHHGHDLRDARLGRDLDLRRPDVPDHLADRRSAT